MRFGTTHWVSPKFPDEYATSLRNQLRRFGHDLTVLGNGADTDEQLVWNFAHWHSKFEWFAPWNAHLRPAVVFDLDTFIIDDPAPMLELDPTRLWLIRQFLAKTHLGESGIFVAPDNEALCAKIWKAAQTWPHNKGDGRLMREFPHGFIPDAVDGIYSYKKHCTVDSYPDDARVICFHGKPKCPNVEGWALEWWLNSLS